MRMKAKLAAGAWEYLAYVRKKMKRTVLWRLSLDSRQAWDIQSKASLRLG